MLFLRSPCGAVERLWRAFDWPRSLSQGWSAGPRRPRLVAARLKKPQRDSMLQASAVTPPPRPVALPPETTREERRIDDYQMGRCSVRVHAVSDEYAQCWPSARHPICELER